MCLFSFVLSLFVCFVCVIGVVRMFLFFFKQKTAYELRISDWSSDVCSSDLGFGAESRGDRAGGGVEAVEVGHRAALVRPAYPPTPEIGRASCRERVCQYVSISVVAVSLKKTITITPTRTDKEHRPEPLQRSIIHTLIVTVTITSTNST